MPPPNRQWRRRPLCVGRFTPPRRACARDGLLTYDRLLGHGLLRRPFRSPLADLFRHLVVKTTAARTMMLKMEKNYPNANSCLMFTFSVVVLHWLDGGRRWLLARRAEPTVPAAADSARRTTDAEVRSIDRCARPAAVAWRHRAERQTRYRAASCGARGGRGAGAIVDGRAAAGDRHRCTLWSRAATTVPIDERARARVLFFIQSLNKMVVGLLCLLCRRDGSTESWNKRVCLLFSRVLNDQIDDG